MAGPAKALIVTAVLGLLFSGLNLAYRFYLWAIFQDSLGFPGGALPPEMMVMLAVEMAQGAASLASMIIAIAGARKMLRLESYGMALAASILMMLPWASPCCLLGLPFGIWAVTVLNRPEVREAFHS